MGRKVWVPTVSGPLAPMLLRAKGVDIATTALWLGP